jgi:replicative DNA helicase
MSTDKISPQIIEAEISILGTCLCYPDIVHEIQLKPEMFYNNSHKKIFAAILDISKKSECDIVALTNYLRNKNELETIGGPVYLTKLTSSIVSSAMVVNHALMVKEKYLLREYIRCGSELINIAHEEDLTEVIEYVESNLLSISNLTQNKEPKIIGKCIDDLLIEVEKIYRKEKSLVGVPSGFTSIDRITGGWQPGNLIIIAGRPSTGKTAMALSLALNPAKLKYPVCLFSLEMSDSEISTRFLSGVSGYSNVEIRNANINFDNLVDKSNEVANLPIYIDDTPAITIFELRSKVKKMILRHGVKLVIVDYLQLMKQEAGNREQEVSKISQGLKAIAKEFSIPVIALSQLNRGVEDRSDKRPKLSDLRESGAIEQDADIVCFIYRPALYSIPTIKIDKEDISTEGLMVVDCAKDRNGALFSKPLYHNESLTIIKEKENGTPY